MTSYNPFHQLSVLIVGDVMIDAYWNGQVHRISPEAPVPVVDIIRKENRLGGAANVALNIKSLGATPFLCTVVGNDAAGKDFLQLCAESNLSTNGVLVADHRPTTVKTRIMGGSQQLLRLDEENTQPISHQVSEQLVAAFLQILPLVDIVIFEDYDKGVLHPSIIKELIHHCQTAGKPTAVDPKKVNFNAFHQVGLFKPNWKELRDGMNLSEAEPTLEVLKSAAKKLREEQGIERLFITLSERGVFMDDGTESLLIPAHIRSIADVSGAGDTVISVASLGLALGWPASKIAGLSNLAGGLVCEQVGVVPINKEKLFEEAEIFGLISR
jgi:rfaE bifunctional protein kinase chain/domain